ncbi:MAG: hydrogenase maturation factor [Lachnospiraceae bacterium]|nr:hydrogenase maturation factor [Lachnospiraceae bacterium]
MKPGKVSESILKRAVIKQLSTKNKNVKNSAAIGNDAALFVVPEDSMILTSTETIVEDYKYQKGRALYRASNNILAGGGTPLTASVSVTLPVSAVEADLRALFKEYVDVSKSLGIAITGGHTEISEAVVLPVVTVTVTGSTDRDLSLKNIRENQDIVLSKAVGLEGSFLLASKQMEFFKTRFSDSYIEKSLEYINDISIYNEAAVAIKHGVTAMHDLSENGIFGGLWEVGEAGKCGLSVNIKDINIHQETVELCEYFDINPYKIPSAGALLMITDNGNKLVVALKESGIESAVIGKITAGNDRVIINEDETRFLEPPRLQKQF